MLCEEKTFIHFLVEKARSAEARGQGKELVRKPVFPLAMNRAIKRD